MRPCTWLVLLALASGLSLAEPAKAADYAGAISAENIGAGFLTFSEMLKQWEDSTGHRENLLMTGACRGFEPVSCAWPCSTTN
jgi:uncharacterized protein YkwD